MFEWGITVPPWKINMSPDKGPVSFQVDFKGSYVDLLPTTSYVLFFLGKNWMSKHVAEVNPRAGGLFQSDLGKIKLIHKLTKHVKELFFF